DLTGNWDSDGDGYYGEPFEDNIYNEPDGDLFPEVYVGRIPFYGSYTDLDSILNKTIHYSGIKQNILLPMAICNYENEEGSGCDRGDGRDLPKYVVEDIAIPNGYGYHVMYERCGLDPVPTTAPYYDEPINKSNVINAWNTDDYGFVFWHGHGSYAGTSRKYWDHDDGDGVPESDEMKWERFISSSDTDTLLDTNVFTYQASCLNGEPDHSDNLQYSLLKNGAICTVAAASFALGPGGFYSPSNISNDVEIGYRYLKNLVNNHQSAGVALYNAKSCFEFDSSYKWQNQLVFNLYGDPSLTVTNVSNREPTLNNPLPDTSFDEDHSFAAFNLNDYFFDPDGESINYT
ncbi:MAG: hypothetical protein COX41_05335, partial [Candidatus Omnitrophica bacterium CG23_combo_of_CG06-09_8_20_14_all_41_10]